MTVNALVSVLIVFRIFKVFQQIKPSSDERRLETLGATGGRKLYSIMSIIIESGMILFSIQLAGFVLSTVNTADAFYAYWMIVPIHEIFNVIMRFSHV